MSISAEPTPRGRNGLAVALRRRVRLIAGLAAMAVAFFAIPRRDADPDPGPDRLERRRLAVSRPVAVMMARGSSESVRAHAAEEDENQWALLAIAIVVATAALAAIVFELGPVKDMTGLRKAEHIGLVAATILSAWTFTHVMFALHYAGRILRAGRGRRAGGPALPRRGDAGLGRIRSIRRSSSVAPQPPPT